MLLVFALINELWSRTFSGPHASPRAAKAASNFTTRSRALERTTSGVARTRCVWWGSCRPTTLPAPQRGPQRMAFARSRQFMARWPRCPHFKQTSLSVFPLAFALTLSCHRCPWNPCPYSCSCFGSSPSRGDQISRTCALLVTVLLQCLHRCCVLIIGSTTHQVRSQPLLP